MIVTRWIFVFLAQGPRAQADRALARPPICPLELTRLIDGAARRRDVNPLLLREVAREEFAFRPCAVSAKGADGLMQLMPATRALLQARNPFSAEYRGRRTTYPDILTWILL